MARLPFIAGNWKMNKTVGEAVELVRQLKASLSGVEGVEVAVAPPFTALVRCPERELRALPFGSQLKISSGKRRAPTQGRYPPLMLKELGCQYVIIGHSERRQFFGETDETVNKRIKTALNQGLNPIFCIGETLKEREGGKTFSVIDSQLEERSERDRREGDRRW